MYEKLFERMGAIVEGTGAQREYEKYDKPFIEEHGLPMIWVVRENCTNLTALGYFSVSFNENESTRYDFVRNGFGTYTYYVDHFAGDGKIYFLSDNGVQEVSAKAVHEIVRDLFTPVVEKWKAENGPLPKNTKLPVRFFNFKPGKIKELIADGLAHNDTSLLDCLKRFRHYVRTAKDQHIELAYNPSWKEFTFCVNTNGEQGLAGGIVFHGWKETGYQENFAVQLTPSYGWSVHT